ncbi:MAG: HAD-IA family hydrolase [Anaeromyxobacter sp.]
MKKLTVFDLDGTLVDSAADLHASVNHALATVGLPLRTLAEVRGFVGEGARRLLERAVGPRLDLLEPALAAWEAHYAAHMLDRTRLYPGLEDELARAGRTLAILTNKPGPAARHIVEGLGLGARFAAVVGGGEAPRKPDPAGLLALVARLGSTPAETVFVGDSVVDVQTGRNAKVPVVAVTWGFGRREDLAGADVLADHASELAPFLR